MIDVYCTCGRLYHADESHVGKSIRCTNPKCQALVPILKGEPLAKTEDNGTQGITPPQAEKSPTVRVAEPPTVGVKPRSSLVTLIGVATLLLAVIVIAALIEDFSHKPATPPTPPPQAANPNAPLETPTCAEEAVERPTTGQRIEPDEGTSGRGRLTITNGTNYDAAVELLDSSDTLARFVYIRAKDVYTIKRIDPGSYSLCFMTGTGWLQTCEWFQSDMDITEFEEPFAFTARLTEEQDGRTLWSTHWEATLHEVQGGTAKTRRIDLKRFKRGHRRVVPAGPAQNL